jgi:hypothetical protein
MTATEWWAEPGFSTVDECIAAATKMADGEDEVENDRGHVDWDSTFDRLESWFHLRLPTDTDAEQYRAMRRVITKARKA